MEKKVSKQQRDEIERELCEQSHKMFGKKYVRTAVNPERQYAG